MPSHPFGLPRGRVEHLTVDSAALRGNLLGDPHERTVALYLPEGHDDSREDYPLFVGLAGFTGSGLKGLAWRAFEENLPQRIDRLVASGKMGPVVLALPDGFTSLGGNQYVNSLATGRWEDFLLGEMIPAIEARFRVRRGGRHRAVFGKSSGGYGALVQALRHGGEWSAAASHSGDVFFDLIYRRDLTKMLDVLARHAGGVSGFLQHLGTAQKVRADEMHALMLLAMAASYDPDPAAPAGIRLPLDPHTGEIDAERWSRWLEHDPLTLVERPECQESLRRLQILYLDCGARDEYQMHYGSRALVRRLERLGIRHRYEEFDDSHSQIDYRLDVSLPLLYESVSGG